jgi:hypothetical protein
MPKDSTGAVLAQVGQALGVFAQFLGASPPLEFTKTTFVLVD